MQGEKTKAEFSDDKMNEEADGIGSKLCIMHWSNTVKGFNKLG